MIDPRLVGPIAIAHRGSRLLWPENTMAAFQGAVDLGYTWLETDLHLSSNGVVMCIHDHTVDRTTDSTGFVRHLDSRSLGSLDAGRALSGFESEGHGVPTLEEVLVTFPSALLVVDLKEDGVEAPLWSLLQRLDAVDRVVVGSFSDRRLRRFRALARGAVLTSAGRSAVARARLGSVAARPRWVADALQVPERAGRIAVVTKKSVEAARRVGMATHVWTINDRADMERLLDWGVDGIITDRPDLLKEVLVARGQWT